MIKLMEVVIRFRNPNFRFDKHLDTFSLFDFMAENVIKLLRGLKLLFRFRNPKGAMLGANTQFRHVHRMQWGNWLKTGNHVRFSALGKSGILIGNNVGIGAYSQVIVSTSLNQIGEFIRIGNNVGIGEFAYLGGAGGLSIGDDCIVGQYFSCHPENHVYDDFEVPVRLQGISRKGISIGKNCWIGSKVTILDGVSIGDHCVIAAGAVLTHSFPSHVVIGGVPARILKHIDPTHLSNPSIHAA